MGTKLEAGYLYAQTEQDVILVGFADKEFDPEKYVLLQGSTFMTIKIGDWVLIKCI